MPVDILASSFRGCPRSLRAEPDCEAGCRSEHRHRRWPQGRAPWMARVYRFWTAEHQHRFRVLPPM